MPKIDPEPYFFRWRSIVIIDPSKKVNDIPVGSPCYQHRTCKGSVPLPEDRIPPKVCPNCGADTVVEAREEEIRKSQGGKLIEAPEKLIDLERIMLPPDKTN